MVSNESDEFKAKYLAKIFLWLILAKSS